MLGRVPIAVRSSITSSTTTTTLAPAACLNYWNTKFIRRAKTESNDQSQTETKNKQNKNKAKEENEWKRKTSTDKHPLLEQLINDIGVYWLADRCYADESVYDLIRCWLPHYDSVQPSSSSSAVEYDETVCVTILCKIIEKYYRVTVACAPVCLCDRQLWSKLFEITNNDCIAITISECGKCVNFDDLAESGLNELVHSRYECDSLRKGRLWLKWGAKRPKKHDAKSLAKFWMWIMSMPWKWIDRIRVCGPDRRVIDRSACTHRSRYQSSTRIHHTENMQIPTHSRDKTEIIHRIHRTHFALIGTTSIRRRPPRRWSDDFCSFHDIFRTEIW